MQPKVRLRRLDIEGFRGVNHPLRIDFPEAFTLVAAANGHGKSSVLGAIEWGLFGELKFQERENATRDELVNLHHPNGRAGVRMVLARGGEEWTIERTRRLGKQTSEFSITPPHGATLRGEEAVALLFRLTGLTSEDFCRAVFLHQDSVRALLLDEPKVRDEALDRLFGLERVRSLLAALSLRPIAQAVAELEAQRKKRTERLSGAVEQLEARRAWHHRAATGAGLEEEDLTLDRARVRAEALVQRWNAEAPEGLSLRAHVVAAADDLGSIAEEVKEATRKLRLSGKARSSDDAVAARLARVRALQRQLAEACALHEEIVRAGERLLQPFGGPDAAKSSVAPLEVVLRDADAQLERLGAMERLLVDAVAYVDAQPAASECPVCEADIDASALRGLLRERTEATRMDVQERLLHARNEAKQELQRLRDALEEWRRLDERKVRAHADIEDRRAQAQALLGSEAKAETALAEEERRLAAAVEAHGPRQTDRERRLQAFEAEAERLILLQRLLFTESEFARLGRAENSDEADSLRQPLDRLLALQEAMEPIVRALQRVASGGAAAAVEASRAEVEAHYRILCDHPYFDGVRIDVEEKVVGGVPKCTYAIRAVSSSDGKTTLASTRLSTAQMNSVALSVCLAMARTLSHRLGFLILDDPSQSFDTKHKAALAGLLRGMAEDTQLIVATHDEEFDALLRERFRDAPFVRHALDWAPRTGSTLRGT